MKKGIEMLGGTFILDGFHLKKYIRRMARAIGEEDAEETVMKYLEKGERKRLKEWVKEKEEKVGEKEKKQLEEGLGYIEKNWKGIRMRIKKEEGVIGSSTESHVSHVLSERMSSRPMGWSRKGAGKLSRLRIYWKNGGEMRLLLEQNREKVEEKKEEEGRCFSAQEMLNWERRNQKRNGKYIEALRATISRQTGMKVYFQQAITGICG